MGHGAFEHIGVPILLDELLDSESESVKRSRLGIFQESSLYDTTAEGAQRPALDFIVPEYRLAPQQQKTLKKWGMKKSLTPGAPVLNFYFGIDHLLLSPEPKVVSAEELADARARIGLTCEQFKPPVEVRRFVGHFNYTSGGFYNDQSEIYDSYRDDLKKAGFLV